jgi:hypothetical protein
MITLWGFAAGRGSTGDCAPGTFTSRTYPTDEAAHDARHDWTGVLYVTEAGNVLRRGSSTPLSSLPRPRGILEDAS